MSRLRSKAGSLREPGSDFVQDWDRIQVWKITTNHEDVLDYEKAGVNGGDYRMRKLS